MFVVNDKNTKTAVRFISSDNDQKKSRAYFPINARFFLRGFFRAMVYFASGSLISEIKLLQHDSTASTTP